jgi:hypothetical protein
MNALDLMARLGGETLNNKIRAIIDGEIVILARMEGQDWVYTDRGQELANLHSNLAADEAAAPKTRKKAAPAVEFAEPTVEPEAVADQPAAE